MRDIMLQEIADMLGCTPKEARTNFRNLRTYFFKEISKIENSRASGKGTENLRDSGSAAAVGPFSEFREEASDQVEIEDSIVPIGERVLSQGMTGKYERRIPSPIEPEDDDVRRTP
ncbi:uncharacterized protein ISCGN_000871 [Ixodes scapularis]